MRHKRLNLPTGQGDFRLQLVVWWQWRGWMICILFYKVFTSRGRDLKHVLRQHLTIFPRGTKTFFRQTVIRWRHERNVNIMILVPQRHKETSNLANAREQSRWRVDESQWRVIHENRQTDVKDSKYYKICHSPSVRWESNGIRSGSWLHVKRTPRLTQ